ncbi:TIGR02302 family protein [Pseudoroseicyclus sp. H15]
MPDISWPVTLTRAGMVAERACRAFWPFWIAAGLALAVLATGWLQGAAVELYWFAGLAFGAALLITLAFGIRRFTLPSHAEALARVDARLPGRPIATLADAQAVGSGDAASEAVWQAHQRRMAEAASRAKAVEPDLRLASRDRYGLRYIVALLLITALLFGSLFRVALPGTTGPGTGATLASGPAWEGWVEPPAYTGRPSLYLADIPPGALSVPEGSTITLRLYGDVGELAVLETVSGRIGDVPSAADAQQSFTVKQDGTLRIEGAEGANWDVRVLADDPPEVRLDGPLQVEGTGEMAQPFRAADDYGVTGGSATIALNAEAVDRHHGLAAEPDAREPITVDLPMPFTGSREDFAERLVDDFSQHPWANLPVTLTLQVEDAAGQTGATEPVQMVLPGRRFFQPIARAVAEQRRDLLWSRDNGRRVLQLLRTVAYEPDGFFPNEISYLRLSFTLRRLGSYLEDGGPLTVEEQDEVAAALWELAVQLEDGTLADARQRLERARDRLAEAMRNGASEEEIQELMNELRQATDDYMQMLAQNAEPMENGADQPQSAQQQMQRITQDEIDALMDQIQQLMEEGRMAEAAELMEELNQLMDNMQMQQAEGGQGMNTPGQQSMEDLSETLREQQGLSDESFQELQEQFGQQGQQGQQSQPGEPGQSGQGMSPGDNNSQQNGQQGENGQGGEGQEGDQQQGGGQSLAERQQALRDELNRQRQNMPYMGGEQADAARGALDRAEEAMDGAEQALREGDLAEAIDRQAEAMNALRDGMRNLGEALAQNQQQQEPGQGQQEGQTTGQAAPLRRDPLGREMGEAGQLGSEENLLGSQTLTERADELMDEIRRRSSERERPKIELDYLRRLLERF